MRDLQPGARDRGASDAGSSMAGTWTGTGAAQRAGAGRLRGVALGLGAGALILMFVLMFGLVLGSTAGCQAQAGMFCQQQSDCSVGLVCTKPTGTTLPASFGVCTPARRGHGETCLRSADCQAGLRCSNEVGQHNGDERHGICEPYEAPPDAAMGPADLLSPPPADLAAPEDQLPVG